MNFKYVFCISLVFKSVLYLQSQDSLNQPASPKGGVNQLAIHYYGIEFTKLQREQLKDKEIEFIFKIDAFGKPTLEEVNGIADPDIIDSLNNRTDYVEHFNPQIRNGIAEESIYFMQLIFPSFSMTEFHSGMLHRIEYKEAKLDDFEYIEGRGLRLDILIGGLLNQFAGSPAEHLATGGGLKMEFNLIDKRDLIYGLNMSMYGNRLKKKYPVNTPRIQLRAPPTLLIGLIFGKEFKKFSVQGELNIAVQNLTARIDQNDQDWVQLKGWSPGLIVNYPIPIVQNKPVYYYGSPTLISHSLNVHFGLRYLSLDLKEASGIMAELGFSYKMGIEGVKNYKLKDDFFKR